MNCFRSLYGLSLHEFLDSDTEPSMISTFDMDGSLPNIEPSMISVFGVEGLLLDIEPSMKRGINVDGSPCCP